MSSSNHNHNSNFVCRGHYYGPIYDVDHLASFTLDAKRGLLRAEDGMRKLRLMERSQGIWTMECELLIDNSCVVVMDKKSGQQVEMFPIEWIADPTSIVSDDKKDIYNNIVLFTVLDNKRRTTPPAVAEMHIFQCAQAHSGDIVDQIYRVKESRLSRNANSAAFKNGLLESSQHRPPQILHYTGAKYVPSSLPDTNSSALADEDNNSRSPVAQQQQKQQQQQQRAARDSMSPSRIDMDVQTLNHCFDDIERFVAHLNSANEAARDADKQQHLHHHNNNHHHHNHHKRKNKKLSSSGATASLDSASKLSQQQPQMPSPEHFVDVFQKFKHSLNLLAKLKAHIHDPNAPELVHFLFTPLALIVNATKELPAAYQGLSKTVWTPMLGRSTKELLLNCLMSKEQDLWLSLGDAWTTTWEEAKQQQLHQPHALVHLDEHSATDAYVPVFADGWTPSYAVSSSWSSLSANGLRHLDIDDNSTELSRLAFATATRIQERSAAAPSHLLHGSGSATQSNLLPLHRTQFNTQPQSHSSSTAYASQHTADVTGGAHVGSSLNRNAPHSAQQPVQQLSRYDVVHSSLEPKQLSPRSTADTHAALLSPKSTTSGAAVLRSSTNNQYGGAQQQTNNSPHPALPTVVASQHNYDDMKKWAADLTYRGAKMYEVTHDRHANNDKELTVKAGELVEVLDDKRNWWRLRNLHGNVGHAPVTILRPLDAEKRLTTLININSGHTSTMASSGTAMAVTFAPTTAQSSLPSLSSSSSSTSSSSAMASPRIGSVCSSHGCANPNISQFSLEPNILLIGSEEAAENAVRQALPPNTTHSTSAAVAASASEETTSAAHLLPSQIAEVSAALTATLSAVSIDQLTNRNRANEQINTLTTSANSIDSKSSPYISSGEPTQAVRHQQQQQQQHGRRQSQQSAILRDIAPMRDLLHEELVKRMSKDKPLAPMDLSKRLTVLSSTNGTTSLTSESSAEDVKTFLVAKEFSTNLVLMFAELNGAQLFSLERADFERFCGKEEGLRLDSQLKLQKSLCGYTDHPSELVDILQKRKQKCDAAASLSHQISFF